MKIIVQKFEGAKTDIDRERIAAKIINARRDDLAVVAVISAGSKPGDPYSIDCLLEFAKSVHPEIPPRELAILLACSENIATVTMAQTLEKERFAAAALNGRPAGIITDDNFGEAHILKVNPVSIERHLQEGRIVLISGSQGVTTTGEITYLGRNSADTTAIAIGAALEVDRVEIYNETNGVTIVDPRIVPETKILRELTYQEVLEISHHGSELINPGAVQIARERNVPVRVKSTLSEDEGTLISNQKTTRIITGITHQGSLGCVSVKSKANQFHSEEAVRVFKVLAGAEISVDMNSISSNQVSFVVKEDLLGKVGDLLLPFGLDLELLPHCAKITLVGVGMQDVPGIMMRVVEALHKHRVKLLQTVDSEITISCLVPESQKDRAIKVLYKEFHL